MKRRAPGGYFLPVGGAAASSVFLLFVLASVTGGCAPMPGPEPDPFDLDTGWGREITLHADSASVLKARFQPGRPGAGAILILHGMGANHRQMVPRARALSRHGFATLLLDFRGHGSSTAAATTYGLRESEDARVALEWLRRARPGERIGVIGVSMGGAAVLLGEVPIEADALVLESVYPTIDHAVRNRLTTWLGPLGLLAAPLVKRVIAGGKGLSRAALRPIDRVVEVTSPLMIAAGTRDPYTPIAESRALFERARARHKVFWPVEGAGHNDLFGFDPAAYIDVVGGFFAGILRMPSTVGSR